MSTKAVAVVMSVYKNDISSQLESAIESILNQTLKSISLYIMIDGMIDNSLSQLLDYYSADERVFIISSPVNRGLAASLNHLVDIIIAEDKFDYIARMDSDDISLPERLAVQIEYFEQHPDIDVLGGYCHEFGASFALDVKKVPLHHAELVKYTFYKCPFIHPTVIFRKRVFQDGNRYPLDTCFSEDLALWFLLLVRGYKFSNLNKVLLNYRINSATLARRSGLKKAISEVKLRVKYSFLLKNRSLKIYILIVARGIFSLMPHPIKKMMYSKLR